MKKVYLVMTEGYFDGYGSQYYLVGIFDNKEDAKEAERKTANKLSILFPEYFDDFDEPEDFINVVEVTANHLYPLKKCNPERDFEWSASTDIYLGGYCE